MGMGVSSLLVLQLVAFNARPKALGSSLWQHLWYMARSLGGTVAESLLWAWYHYARILLFSTTPILLPSFLFSFLSHSIVPKST